MWRNLYSGEMATVIDANGKEPYLIGNPMLKNQPADRVQLAKHLGVKDVHVANASMMIESLYFHESSVGPLRLFACRSRIFLNVNRPLLEYYGLHIKGTVVLMHYALPLVTISRHNLLGQWKRLQISPQEDVIVSSNGQVILPNSQTITTGDLYDNRRVVQIGKFEYDVAFLVLSAFSDHFLGKRVMHINGLPHDNRLQNLMSITE